MAPHHKLLERQLRKYCRDLTLPAPVQELLKAISCSYDYFDEDRRFLDRAMEVSARELMDTNQKLQEELKNKQLAEEAIFEKDQIIRSINENLREAVFRISKNKVIYVNQAFLDLFGYESEEEVLKQQPARFYCSTESHMQLLRNLIRHQAVKSEQILFRRKDGSEFWGLISTMITYNKDGDNFFDGAIVDITAQKKNEENLKVANLQLQKVNAEMDRFVYSVSHDLRSPLKSIMGLLNLIELEKESDISLYLDRMRQSVVKLDNFISDIIDYSLNARVEVTAASVDIKDVVEDCFLHFKYLPFSDSIKKTITVNDDVPFYGDKKRLQIVFNNLISNAINYRNPAQQQSFIRVDITTTPEFTSIVVEDNGSGIDAFHIDKIFNMFYRGTTESTGSGLGLYIVKEALEKMGGMIKVHSQKNIGTTFTIQVPNRYHESFGLRDTA